MSEASHPDTPVLFSFLSGFTLRPTPRPTKQPPFTATRPHKTFISLDQAMNYVGDNSQYAKNAIAFVSLFWVWYGCLSTGLGIFLGADFTLRCRSRRSQTFAPCDYSDACRHFNLRDIEVLPAHTLRSDFKLICEQEYLVGRLASTIFLTNFLATLLVPFVVDRVGRRTTVVAAGTIGGVSVILAGLAGSFSAFTFFFSVMGFSLGALEIACRVFVSEISGPNFRCNANSVLNVVFVAGQLLLSLIHVFVRGWRAKFVFVIGALLLSFAILGALRLDESPRFLEARGRIAVA